MPNIQSAKKRLRKSLKQREVNAPHRTYARSGRRAFNEAIEAGDPAKAELAFRELCSGVDKAVKAGVMNRNTAIRSKTRAANRLRATTAATTP